jgi:hypothetical protein
MLRLLGFALFHVFTGTYKVLHFVALAIFVCIIETINQLDPKD